MQEVISLIPMVNSIEKNVDGFRLKETIGGKSFFPKTITKTELLSLDFKKFNSLPSKNGRMYLVPDTVKTDREDFVRINVETGTPVIENAA